MLAKSLRIALPVLVGAVLLGGCSKLENRIEGDVFIVTKGGESVKLGLISVNAVLADDAKVAIEKTKASIGAAKKREEEAQSKLTAADSTKARIVGTAGIFPSAESQRAYDLAAAEVRTAQSQWAEASDSLSAALKAGTSEAILTALPKPVSATKTDADGKFSLVIPRWKRVLIVAAGSRQTFKTTEEYLWIVPGEVPAGAQRLMLSNDNLFRSSTE